MPNVSRWFHLPTESKNTLNTLLLHLSHCSDVSGMPSICADFCFWVYWGELGEGGVCGWDDSLQRTKRSGGSSPSGVRDTADEFLANVNSRSRSLYAVVRPSVCRMSVTFVRPTHAIEIFGRWGGEGRKRDRPPLSEIPGSAPAGESA